MRFPGRLVALTLGCFLFVIPASAADKKKPKPLSAAEVFKRAAPAIVAIDCMGPDNKKIGSGSGFIVSDNGKIVTNLHVIQTCSNVIVRLTSGDIYDTANVVDVDARRDLAIIRIKGASLPVLVMADSNAIEVGQVVFSIGNAGGLQNTLQQGLVSSIRPVNGLQLIQVSASINPGNSGGPVLDDQAHVIAVAALKITGAENLGFAIPVNYAKGLAESKTEATFASFAAAIKQAVAANAAKSGSPPSAAPPPPPPSGVTSYGDPLGKIAPPSNTPGPMTGAPFSLKDSFDATGITSDGKNFREGLDGVGYAYSAALLGSRLTWDRTVFALGPSDGPDAVSGNGKTLLLPSGRFAFMRLLGAGVNGEQIGQFRLTYSDGTSVVFTQNFSDWTMPKNFPAESIALRMNYRNFANGGTESRTTYLYGYTFTLNAGKTVSAIILPTNRNLRLLAMTLIAPMSPGTGAAPRQAVPPPATGLGSSAGAAIDLTTDRIAVFLRGKIGDWSADDAKAVFGVAHDQSPDKSGSVLLFDTPRTAFTNVTLHFGANGKLESVDMTPANRIPAGIELARLRELFPGDPPVADQNAGRITYRFNRSRTSFTAEPAGPVLSFSIF